MNKLVAAFNEYFEVISADTPQLLQEVFRLRYQVLCVEQRLPGFDPSKYPDMLEKDDYDHHSVYILLQHRPSKAYVGTARLLLADPLDSEKPFPGEQHAQLDPTLIDISKLSRQYTAEISRFAVLSRFPHHSGERRGLNTGLDIVGEGGTKSRHRFPHTALALTVGIARMCAENNIIHLFSVMDPALNRLLGLYGLNLDTVGPLTDYHGLRRPYFVNLINVFNRTYLHHHRVWELVTDYGRIWPAPLEQRARPRPINISQVATLAPRH